MRTSSRVCLCAFVTYIKTLCYLMLHVYKEKCQLLWSDIICEELFLLSYLTGSLSHDAECNLLVIAKFVVCMAFRGILFCGIECILVLRD